jgi:pyruvyltransferase
LENKKSLHSTAINRRPHLRWCQEKGWGDALNPILFRCLSGMTPSPLGLFDHAEGEVYLMLGSILGFADDRTIVWGPGFIREDQTVTATPREVLAVRGPASRRKLVQEGIECPEIYGDPALLYPFFYLPPARPCFELGVVPHYVDKEHPALSILSSRPEVLVIDVESGTQQFVDQLRRCRRIASSALHGLVAADAYRIPSRWVRFSDKVIGGSFKFRDYLESVHRPLGVGLEFTPASSFELVMDGPWSIAEELDLGALVRACPFIDHEVRSRLLSQGTVLRGLVG